MKKLKEVSSVWTILQAAEITEMFAAGETGICSCCMVQSTT
jgi:hypothetical protein